MHSVEMTANRELPPTSDYSGVARSWSYQFDGNIVGMRCRHNTFLVSPRNDGFDNCFINVAYSVGVPLADHEYTDNLIAMRDGPGATRWWVNDGGGTGNTGWTEVAGTNVFSGNAITRTSTVPTGNVTASSIAAANVNATTLEIESGSSFLGAATDGRDPGIPVSLLNSTISGVAP